LTRNFPGVLPLEPFPHPSPSTPMLSAPEYFRRSTATACTLPTEGLTVK